MNEDMLAIPMTEIMSMIKKVEGEGKVAMEDCVLVVPKDASGTKFYVMKKEDLWK